MSGYTERFDETKYMSFLIKKTMNCWKNMIKP